MARMDITEHEVEVKTVDISISLSQVENAEAAPGFRHVYYALHPSMGFLARRLGDVIFLAYIDLRRVFLDEGKIRQGENHSITVVSCQPEAPQCRASLRRTLCGKSFCRR